MSNADARAVHLDVGLRKYMLGVYNYMASALVLTGIVAMVASQSQTIMMAIHGSPLKWVLMLSIFGFAWFFAPLVMRMSAAKAQVLFWAFAVLMGLSLSYIFLLYTGASIATTFFATAVSFGALSLYGYTTKRDLAPMAAFLFMGMIGVIVCFVINMFIGSETFHMVISAIAVLVVAGITAFQTQQTKDMYYEGDSSEVASKKSIIGAFGLYLSFINMFVMLLQFLGVAQNGE